jgi:hypothetical protein
MSDDRKYASSPCMWHELEESSPQQPVPAPLPHDVAGWRRRERTAQIEARQAMPPSIRADMATRIVAALERLICNCGRS